MIATKCPHCGSYSGSHAVGCPNRDMAYVEKELVHYQRMYNDYVRYTQLWAERYHQAEKEKANLARETNLLRKRLYPGKC